VHRKLEGMGDMLHQLGEIEFNSSRLAADSGLTERVFDIIPGAKQTLCDQYQEHLRYPKECPDAEKRRLKLAHDTKLLELIPDYYGCKFSPPSPAQAGGGGKRIAVVFGPEHGAIDSQLVFEAAREAYFLKFDALYLFGFAIQAKARELVADRKKLRLPCVYVSVTPDVAMSDLLKTSQSSQVFSVTGLPDVRVERLKAPTQGGDPLFRVALLGLDIFRPQDLETEAIAAINLPCWMLDTDYNGMVFMARQVFFPKTSAWENLEKSLRGRFAEGVWAHLAGTVSEPFATGPQRQIAVKVIDERGNELMVVKPLAG
jgi:hypothetical protein